MHSTSITKRNPWKIKMIRSYWEIIIWELLKYIELIRSFVYIAEHKTNESLFYLFNSLNRNNSQIARKNKQEMINIYFWTLFYKQSTISLSNVQFMSIREICFVQWWKCGYIKPIPIRSIRIRVCVITQRNPARE